MVYAQLCESSVGLATVISGSVVEPQIQPRVLIPASGSSFCILHSPVALAGGAVVGAAVGAPVEQAARLILERLGPSLFRAALACLLCKAMMVVSALVTIPSIVPELTGNKFLNSNRGTPRVVPTTFSTLSSRPPICLSTFFSSVVRASGIVPAAILSIQSFTFNGLVTVVIELVTANCCESIWERGVGAAGVLSPVQKALSILQDLVSFAHLTV